MFSKPVGDKLYFTAIPDVASGIIPTFIPKGQEELHEWFLQYSDNIYLGDLSDNWNHPDYKTLQIDYQVIRPGKLEKDTRNQIHQAERKGVTIDVLRPEYWDCVIETASRQNRRGISKWTFDKMFNQFSGLVALLNNKVIAGCIYTEEDNIVRLVHQASLTDYLSYRPNHLIYKSLIDLAGDREIWCGNGQGKFKETFGATTRTFPLKYYEA